VDTASTFLSLFAGFHPVLTMPTTENLGVLVRGAVLSNGPRTVTECLRSAWPRVRKHHSAYENVLRRARMPQMRMCRMLFEMALSLLYVSPKVRKCRRPSYRRGGFG